MCKYCEQGEPLRQILVTGMVSSGELRTDETAEVIDIDICTKSYEGHLTFPANYCPMCGRPLGGDAA